jgi:expansin (peptidoglycan-binding protein)
MSRLIVCIAAGAILLTLMSCAKYPVIEYNGTVHEGEGTYYEDGLLGNCSYPMDLRPKYHAAMNHNDYADSRACGTYVNVRRKDDPQKREVTVLIDNQCPECSKGDIDLSPAAFKLIAEHVEGRVPIEWSYVPAPKKGPLRFRWKESSCKWWLQILVMDHQYAVTKVEMQAPGLDWTALVRKKHNYWEAKHGLGKSEGPFNIRVTDVLGNTHTDYNLPLTPGQIVNGAGTVNP